MYTDIAPIHRLEDNTAVLAITMQNVSSLSSLLTMLTNTPRGAIEGQVKHKVLSHLASCWDELKGADQTAMEPWKLARTEEMSWNPPILSFFIERHGATVAGSTRAELQHWSIDIHRRTADCMQAGRRQVRKASPRLSVEPIAARVCEAVQRGPTSQCDLVRERIIEWKDVNEVCIHHGKLILDQMPKQTVVDRRKRLRMELEARMQTIGWSLQKVQRSMVFKRMISREG
jgi:hypothetical protein